MGKLLLPAPESGFCLTAHGATRTGSVIIPRTAKGTGNAWIPAVKRHS